MLVAPALAAISTTGDVLPVYPSANPDPWNVGDELLVGDLAAGTLLIDSGSDVLSIGGTVGFESLVTGTITVTGTGSTWTNSQNVALGVFGIGRLEVLDGAQVENQDAFVGHTSGNGQVLVSGADSQWNNIKNLFVGNSGTGSLTIQSQGLVRSDSAVIAVSNSSQGTVVVDGQQSAWEVTKSLSVGDASNGGMASLSLTGTGSRVYVGAAAVTQGATLPIDHTAIVVSSIGTPAKLSVFEGNSIQNAGSAYIGAGAGESGTVVVDGAGTTWINGGGVFVGLNGSGTLTLVGSGSVSSSGPVAVGAAGVVSGVGTVIGSLSNAGTVKPGQTLQPGQTVGQLTVNGSYSQDASGKLQFDLTGTVAGTFDTLHISNQAMLDGALEVELGLDGGSPFVPQLGNSFDVVTATGGLTGAFTSADLPALSAGKMWHVRYSANAATLVVKLAGDYNDDGTVDAADYTVWRDRLGNTLDPSADGDTNGVVDLEDYNIWKANFGATAGAGATIAAAAVPEPANLGLVAALLSVFACNRCAHRH
jgi:T5SS/PEP-CTERM-associated repeat protein